MANYKEILTIEEAAKYLRIGKRSMYKLIKSGKLPYKNNLRGEIYENNIYNDSHFIKFN